MLNNKKTIGLFLILLLGQIPATTIEMCNLDTSHKLSVTVPTNQITVASLIDAIVDDPIRHVEPVDGHSIKVFVSLEPISGPEQSNLMRALNFKERVAPCNKYFYRIVPDINKQELLKALVLAIPTRLETAQQEVKKALTHLASALNQGSFETVKAAIDALNKRDLDGTGGSPSLDDTLSAVCDNALVEENWIANCTNFLEIMKSLPLAKLHLEKTLDDIGFRGNGQYKLAINDSKSILCQLAVHPHIIPANNYEGERNEPWNPVISQFGAIHISFNSMTWVLVMNKPAYPALMQACQHWYDSITPPELEKKSVLCALMYVIEKLQGMITGKARVARNNFLQTIPGLAPAELSFFQDTNHTGMTLEIEWARDLVCKLELDSEETPKITIYLGDPGGAATSNDSADSESDAASNDSTDSGGVATSNDFTDSEGGEPALYLTTLEARNTGYEQLLNACRAWARSRQ
jgi:hypothetical protein